MSKSKKIKVQFKIKRRIMHNFLTLCKKMKKILFHHLSARLRSKMLCCIGFQITPIKGNTPVSTLPSSVYRRPLQFHATWFDLRLNIIKNKEYIIIMEYHLQTEVWRSAYGILSDYELLLIKTKINSTWFLGTSFKRYNTWQEVTRSTTKAVDRWNQGLDWLQY